MTSAIMNALNAGGAAAAPAQPSPLKGQGRRFFAAMIAARESKCECKSCELLRSELDEAIGDLLKVMSDETDAPPPATQATPTSAAVAELVNGGPEHN